MSEPTPYPEVNVLLEQIRAGAERILGSGFVGMYLYGSLTLNAFNDQSDIDFLVVTDEPVSDAALAALAALHDRIAASGLPYADQLEGSYIPKDALRRHIPAQLHPHIDRGAGERLTPQQHDSDWVVQRYVLREHGITVAGPPPDTLIDPISADDLRGAVRELLDGWWGPMIDDPFRLEVHNGYHAYAVQSMCRILYTLKNGTVVSKPDAARWAQAELDGRWQPLIERAMSWQMTPTDVPETLAFFRYTLDQSRQISSSANGT
jgi:predicted nucleotidyltransferase